MDKDEYFIHISKILDEAVNRSRTNTEGTVADYIPELAQVDVNKVSSSIMLSDGQMVSHGDDDHVFTLQSVAKLVVLIALLEDYGQAKVFSWINAEPSGYHFSSISQLELFGAIPSNPMLNAGAIALCSHIPGDLQERATWLDTWIEKLFGSQLKVNGKVFASERATSDKNRSIAYLLKSNGVLALPVEEVLETYCYLCSYECDTKLASYLAVLLSNGGQAPNGTRVLSEETVNIVVSIMATCGLYDESGMHLVRTGMPAKSGVSGLMIAIATGRGGIAVSSPLLNKKGGSVRGHMIIGHISKELGWHFASPWGYTRVDSGEKV